MSDARAGTGMEAPFTERVAGVTRRDGRLWLEAPGRDEPVAVTVRWLRPLTARREIVFLDAAQKEVLTAVGVEAVEGAGRALVEEALRERYYLTRITRVNRIDVQFGTRYWEVETERGPRWFALREPGKNVLWLGSDHLIVRDTAGNRFEILDLPALDGRSRRAVRLAL